MSRLQCGARVLQRDNLTASSPPCMMLTRLILLFSHVVCGTENFVYQRVSHSRSCPLSQSVPMEAEYSACADDVIFQPQ